MDCRHSVGSVGTPEVAIATRGLTKQFDDITAVAGLDLRVHAGEVFGFLGPNGAGKSTTIRLLLDLVRPTSGSAQIFGYGTRLDARHIHSRVGYLPSDLMMPASMTGQEYLDFLSTLRKRGDPTVRAELIERFELDVDRRIGEMSAGTRQRVGVVQAFMHQPDLVFLDEPSRGLDPLMQRELRQYVCERRDDGMSVFLSSHTLAEVDQVADRVGIIREGRLVAVETLAEIRRTSQQHFEVRMAATDLDSSDLIHVEGVVAVEATERTLRVTVQGSPHHLLRALVGMSQVESIRTVTPDLEELFLEYYVGTDA